MFHIEQGKVYFKSSVFWSSLYLFKLGLFALSLINLSILPNFAVFLGLCVHFQKKWINIPWRTCISILAFMLFYHDSYLPSIQQILAQKDNLQNFSLDYVIEFIIEFVNIYMIVAIVVAACLILFINQFVRMATFIAIAIIVLPCLNIDEIRSGIKNTDLITVNSNLWKLKKDSSDIEKSIYTKSKIESLYTKFYEEQSSFSLTYPEILGSYRKFNIIVVNIDGLSNYDLSNLDLSNKSTLKRFDMYFTDFNTVSTDTTDNLIRLTNSLCGQTSYAKLNEDFQVNCSVLNELEKRGYKSEFLLSDTIDQKRLEQELHQREVINIKPSDDFIQICVNSIKKTIPKPVFEYINLKAPAQETSVSSYEKVTDSYLTKIGLLMNELENLNRNSLLILLPTHGSFVYGDLTQLKGTGLVPSKRLTQVSAMVKFFKKTPTTERVVYDKTISYMGLTDLIFRIMRADSFNPKFIFSPKALVEDLPHAKFFNETSSAKYIQIDTKEFYKKENSDWMEYKN